MTQPISNEEIHIDPNKRTAVIYSVDDLVAYIVEINYQHKSYFIEENKRAVLFGNLAEAKEAALKHHAEEAFLALSKTYQEVDMSNDNPRYCSGRYDYIRVGL
jgi:hypothetical protein